MNILQHISIFIYILTFTGNGTLHVGEIHYEKNQNIPISNNTGMAVDDLAAHAWRV